MRDDSGLSDFQRHLLLHHVDGERIVSRRARSHQHLRLLAFTEHVIHFGKLLISVTRAGDAALNDGPSAA
jgi:hypothetical protein